MAFELINIDSDSLRTIAEKYDKALIAFEKSTFDCLGQENNKETKERALNGKSKMQSRLKELMDERKEKTSIFNDIVKEFTKREKQIEDFINRLQLKANECLKLEKAAIDEANKKLEEAKEKIIEEIKNDTAIPEPEKIAKAVEETFIAAVEIIDDAKSRTKIDAKIESKSAFLFLVMWYVSTKDFQERTIEDLERLNVGNMLVSAKNEFKHNPNLMIPGIKFEIMQFAK